MRITDIIHKKRSCGTLSREEIEFFINGYVTDTIPDYQISALLMAIWFNGMDKQETTDLTLAMAASGDNIDLSSIPGIKADKHSTGGVADTTTLIVAPLVAACGGRVAKMSGRGLGHSGGTIDKLESIPGFRTGQTMESFISIVNDCGFSIIGQTAKLVPADKKIYSLRDVTDTVDNISLIASSIMSKKIASGSDVIVLDVKAGSGAFMKTPKQAEELAGAMVDIGNLAGKKTQAVVTDMNQPLGNAVGNALEVREAIEILHGKHPGALRDVSLVLAERMLILSGICSESKEAQDLLRRAVLSGEALSRFSRMIKRQGGNSDVVDDIDILPRAESIIPVEAEHSGYIGEMITDRIGTSAQVLGAGRQKKSDSIDPAVGIWLKKRLGDSVKKGDILAEFHVNDKKNLETAVKGFINAVKITEEKPQLPPLVYKIIK